MYGLKQRLLLPRSWGVSQTFKIVLVYLRYSHPYVPLLNLIPTGTGDLPIHTDQITISGFSSSPTFLELLIQSYFLELECWQDVRLISIHSSCRTRAVISRCSSHCIVYYQYNGAPEKPETWDPDPPGVSVNQSVAALRTNWKNRLIDSPKHIRNQRIFIWAGTADEFHSIGELKKSDFALILKPARYIIFEFAFFLFFQNGQRGTCWRSRDHFRTLPQFSQGNVYQSSVCSA
jgi:hypothetical protein